MNKINRQTDIGIEIPDNLPDFLLEKILSDIDKGPIEVTVHRRSSLMIMASIDWLLPTAIVAYIFKPYFEGLLNEMGKDHYDVLKTWLKKLTEYGSQIGYKKITSANTPDKKMYHDTQSKGISIVFEAKNGKLIKLLFDDELTKEDWDLAIDKLLDFVIEHYENHPKDSLSELLLKCEPEPNFKVYSIIDKNTKELIFYSEIGAALRQRDLAKSSEQ